MCYSLPSLLLFGPYFMCAEMGLLCVCIFVYRSVIAAIVVNIWRVVNVVRLVEQIALTTAPSVYSLVHQVCK